MVITGENVNNENRHSDGSILVKLQKSLVLVIILYKFDKKEMVDKKINNFVVN